MKMKIKNTDSTDVLSQKEPMEESDDKTGLKVSDSKTVNSTVSDSKQGSITVVEAPTDRKDGNAVESVKWKDVINAAGLILKTEKDLIYPIQFRDKLGSLLNIDDENALLDWEEKLIKKGWITQNLKSRLIKATFKLLRRSRRIKI